MSDNIRTFEDNDFTHYDKLVNGEEYMWIGYGQRDSGELYRFNGKLTANIEGFKNAGTYEAYDDNSNSSVHIHRSDTVVSFKNNGRDNKISIGGNLIIYFIAKSRFDEIIQKVNDRVSSNASASEINTRNRQQNGIDSRLSMALDQALNNSRNKQSNASSIDDKTPRKSEFIAETEKCQSSSSNASASEINTRNRQQNGIDSRESLAINQAINNFKNKQLQNKQFIG